MDFILAILMLFIAILFGLYCKEIIHALFHKKNKRRK